MKILGYILETIYWIVTIISFVKLRQLYWIKRLSINMRFFFLYPMIAIMLMIPALLCKLNYINCEIFLIANELSLIFHYSFLTWFIIFELNDKRIQKAAKILSIILGILVLSTIVNNHNIQFLEYVVAYMSVFIFTSLYFLDIFIHIPDRPILQIPQFWVIIGVFVNAVILTPPLVLSPIIVNDYPLYKGLIVSLTSVACIIMYLSFIKGAKCIRVLQS